MKPLNAASVIAQEVNVTDSREQPVNVVENRFSLRSRDCDEEEEEGFYTPPSSVTNSLVRPVPHSLPVTGTVSATGDAAEPQRCKCPATVSAMPEKVTFESVSQLRTPGSDTQDALEPELSRLDILSMRKQQNEMQLELQQHRRQLDELLKSHDDLTQGNKKEGIQVVKCAPHITPGTAETEHEPELSSLDILSMIKRQNEMQLDIQQHRRQLDELMIDLKSRKDLPSHGNDKRAQDVQAEERGAVHNKILCLPLTESHIHHISKDPGDDWKTVARELKLTQADVVQIDADFTLVREKTYQALLRWRRKESSNATVGRLVTALDNVGRCDVSDILKGLVVTDVSIPAAPPSVCQSNIAVTREEQSQVEEKECNAIGESLDFTTNAQTFDGTLEKLHRVLKELTQNEAHDKIRPEIQNLLEVQRSCEEIAATGMPLQRKDSSVIQQVKTHQTIRKEQARQISKLLENVPAEPCKKCRTCKSCKEKRRNTHDGLKERPKISRKERKTKSLYSETADLTTHLE